MFQPPTELRTVAPTSILRLSLATVVAFFRQPGYSSGRKLSLDAKRDFFSSLTKSE